MPRPSFRLSGAAFLLAVALACGGGGGGTGAPPAPDPGTPVPAGPSAPAAVFPVAHAYRGDPVVKDIVPSAHAVALGGGKVWFLDNAWLQSYDTATGAFAFEAKMVGLELVHEGNPWAIDRACVQGWVGGKVVNASVDYARTGPVNVGTSDGAGHLLLACEGNSAGNPATLVQVDVATQAMTSTPFRPWTSVDTGRSYADPYSGIAVDAAHQRAYIISWFHHDITRVHLDDGTVEHFSHPGILYPSRLATDGRGGVVFYQPDALWRMAPDGTFTSRAWSSPFYPSDNGGYWMAGIRVDAQGRAWIATDVGVLLCAPPEGEMKRYALTHPRRGGPAWIYGGFTAFDRDRLWIVNNHALSIAEGDLYEIQVPPDGTLAVPDTPRITLGPSNAQAGQLKPFAFHAGAAANGILTYQWLQDGWAIPFAHGTTYAVPEATGADVGTFTCVITNHLYGKTATVTTDPVRLDLIQSPLIASFSAVPRWVQAGQAGTLLAAFSGGTGKVDPGGIPILPGVPLKISPATATTYQLTVTNALGETAKASAAVEVEAPVGLLPALSAQPWLVPFGQPAHLSWTVDPSVTRLTLQDDLGLLGPLDVGGTTGQALVPTRRQRLALTAQASGVQGTRFVQVAAQGLEALAGRPGGMGHLDGQGEDARLSETGPMAVKPDGTVIFADILEPVIRQATPDGRVTTLAGLSGKPGDQDGPAASARFGQVTGLALAGDGTLFILDHVAQKLKKLTTDGQVATVTPLGGAGSGFILEQMAMDARGNLLVPSEIDGKVHVVSPAGTIIRTITGLTYPIAVAALPDGRVLALDSFGSTLKYVGDDGKLTTVWPSIAPGDPLAGRPVGAARGLTVDASGKIYISTVQGVFSLDESHLLHTVATESGTPTVSGTFFGNVMAAPQGFLWVVRTGSGAELHRLEPGQASRRVAGLARPYALMGQDLPADAFNNACGVALGPDRSFYVADMNRGKVRKVFRAGGMEEVPLPLDARIDYWSGLTVDGSGRIVFSNYQWIYRFDPRDRSLTPLVRGDGRDYTIYDGGFGEGTVGDVRGMAQDKEGNLFFLDTISETDPHIGVYLVRVLKADGSLATLAGGRWGFEDGTGAKAKFGFLRGIALDPDGNLIVVDQGNHAIRRVTPAGLVTTVAGGNGAGYQDGPAALARFFEPSGVAVDAKGNIFVADTRNASIRLIRQDGTVSTLLGNPDQPGTRSGAVGFAGLYRPTDIQVDAEGDLFITDGGQVLQFTAPLESLE